MAIPAAPFEHDFSARQGVPWIGILQLFEDEAETVPFDWTGYAIDMHIREGVADSGATVKAHLSNREGSDETPRIFFIGKDSNGLPVIDGPPDPTNGFIMLKLPAAETSEITPTKPRPRPGSYPFTAEFYYDIEYAPAGGEPDCLAFGKWSLALEVTRR